MPSYSQRLLVLMYYTTWLHGNVSTQEVLKTAVLDSEVTFTCTIESTVQASWTDITNSNLRIYNMNVQREPVKTEDAEQDPKYIYYSAELVSETQYDLMISSVNTSDVGVLLCEDQVTGSDYVQYRVTVEGKVTSVTIDCQSPCNISDATIEAEEMTECHCTCHGIGGYPDSLTLEWNKDSAGTQITESTSSGRYGTYDFLRTVTVTTVRDESPLECKVSGYTEQSIMESTDIVKQLSFNILYAPNCTLTLEVVEIADPCTVMLTCMCDANPKVTTDGYFYVVTGIAPIDSTSSSATTNVPLDITAGFSCGARNSIGNGEHSEPAKTYTCSKPPFPVGLVIGLSCGVLALVAVGGLIVYRFCYRTSSRKRSVTGSNNLALRGGNTNPSYTEPAYDEVEKDTQAKSTGNNFDPPGGADNNTVTASTNETTNSAAPVYGVVNKSTKKKSDNTDGNGVNSKLQSEPDQVEYAAVNKPKSDPQPAPRSSKPPGNNTEPEKVELQYADIDHSNRGRSNEIHQPADAPTEYATVQSVIV